MVADDPASSNIVAGGADDGRVAAPCVLGADSARTRRTWQTPVRMSDIPVSRDTRVVWSRGKGCRELAEILSSGPVSRVQGDPAEACVRQRADLLVARRLRSGFDLVDSIMPVDVELERVTSVVAAVAGGPHSLLAARLARRLGSALEVPATMVSAYPDSPDRTDAREAVDEIRSLVPELEHRVIETEAMAELVDYLDDGTLLVLGAPGGSWFRRRLFGPGARLRAGAPAGAVIAQAAPRRVFQVMGEPVYVAPMLHAVDTLRIRSEWTMAVAEDGRLVGVVRRDRLARLDPDTPVGEAMEEPLSIRHVEPVDAAAPLRPIFGPDPIPVTDDDDNLVGGLEPPAA